MKRYIITLPAFAITGIALIAAALWWSAPPSGAQALARPASKRAEAPGKIKSSARSSDSNGYIAGVWKEEMAGDIAAAAQAYSAKIAEFDATRGAAATSIFRLAETYQRLGRTQEAQIQYARLLREFIDYPALTKIAQKKIAEAPTTSRGETTAAGLSTSAVTPEVLTSEPSVRELFLEEMALLKNEIEATETEAKQGLVSPTAILPLKRELLRLQQQLAAADSVNSRSDEQDRPVNFASQDTTAQRSGITPEQIADEPAVRELVLEEMALLKRELDAVEAQITVSLAPAAGALPLRRELIRLQQRLASADAIKDRRERKENGH